LIGEFGMTTLLLSALARENAASNHRIADSVRAASRPSGKQPNESEDSSRRSMERSAWDVLRHTMTQAEGARNLWKGTLAVFEDGIEGTEAREVIQTVQEVFRSWFDLEKSTRDLWALVLPIDAARGGLQDLDRAYRDVEGLSKAADEMHAFLTNPRRPVDANLLEKGRQAVAAGQFKNPEAMRGRQHY
jgi:hypothetical protein